MTNVGHTAKRPFPHSLSILFYADIHHGDRSNGRVQQDMLDAEQFITDLAYDRRVDWVVFGGDAFKSRNPHDETKTKWLRARASRSRTLSNVNELDVVGNHCRWYKSDDSGHVFEALDACVVTGGGGVRVVADKCGTYHSSDDRVVFHCLPAQTLYDADRWKPDARKLNICVAHGMVKGCALNAAGTVKAEHGIPMGVLDRSEFDFVLLGDVHIPQVLDFKNTQGGYVGSTLQLDAADTGEKRGCMVVTFREGDLLARVEFIPVPQAELKTLVWDTSSPLPSLAGLEGQLVTLVVRNACGVPAVDLAHSVDKVRHCARHLVVREETPGLRAERGEHAVQSSPLEDFTGYLDRMPGLDAAQRVRVLQILEQEVLHV